MLWALLQAQLLLWTEAKKVRLLLWAEAEKVRLLLWTEIEKVQMLLVGLELLLIGF